MEELPIELYQVAQIRELEQLAIQQQGLTESELMSRAGLAAFQLLEHYFSDAENIIVLCGHGNNGGDGFELARLAHEAGFVVHVYYLGLIDTLPDAARAAALAARAASVPMSAFSATIDLNHTDLIVDAVLGLGISGEVQGDALAAIELMNSSEAEVLALDTPSGLDVNKGIALGDATLATATMTFIGIKQGLVTGEALNYVGELHCDSLGIEEALFFEVPLSGYRLPLADSQALLPPRSPDCHKGDFGRVLIIGGDYGMPGAVRLTGEAALRIGAGLVSVVTRPEHVAPVVSGRPELMCHGVSDPNNCLPLLEAADVIIIGPGLGDSTWSKALYDLALMQSVPLVIDASALHLLAKKPSQRDNWILTPHPGEAAALLAIDREAIQQDRFAAAVALHQKYGGVSVLKGAGTIVQAPDTVPEVCHVASPALATAGSGDVLSGVIGGLLAQGLELAEAASVGCCLHAHAGEQMADGGDRGCVASDLFPVLQQLVNPTEEEEPILDLEDFLPENDAEDIDETSVA